MKTRLWLYLAIMVMAACNSNSAPETEDDLGIKSAAEKNKDNLAMVTDARSFIKDGDLILRTGNDFSSEQVKQFSKKDKTYSHGGIAFHDSGDIYIYHVVPDYYHIKDKVRKEKLDSFCNPTQNLGFAIARYEMDSSEIRVFHDYLDQQYQKKIPFDMTFNLASDDSMYCSEMIKKGLILATNDRIHIENEKMLDRSKYRLIMQHLKMKQKDFVGTDYVPIDHLFIRPDCKVIKRYIYE
ncbi:MAG TPA: YiiX/YebB-like N1pC/P60 family cysteine hydrolase [Chitinophagaceae bacterium]|nr:YiiX/YebB-like N1pC/P60 family cysteine hydrolase [Chitinophagaceae bacterium]